MIEALVVTAVAGLAMSIGYKWGSHEATENAISTIENFEYTEEADGRTSK